MKKRKNKTRRNLLLDSGLAVIMLGSLTRDVTGRVIHEWLGIALSGLIIVHLWMHRKWVVAITKRIFGDMPDRLRLTYLLNLLLFTTFSALFVSGIMISKHVMGIFGLAEMGGDRWSGLHELAKDGVLLLTTIHVGIHWKWIVRAVRKNFGRFLPKKTASSRY